jgi:PAS domain S-box-containing protein
MTESTYQQLFDNSPIPMYVYDAATLDFYAVNEAAVAQYGYTQDEFIHMKATDIRPSEQIASFMKANLEEPEKYVDLGHWLHKKKNGDIFYVHIYGHTARFAGKKVRVILAMDVDNKVRNELELKTKDAEITNILESITDGFYALNTNWEVIYFNKAAEQIMGYDRAEVTGKNIWEFFPDSMEGKFYPEYNRVMNERISVQFEEFYAPLGLWGSMHVYPTQDGIAVYFVDITQQKKIQEKILRDEENLRAIINNTSDVIWSIDTQYNFISANIAFWDRLEVKTGRRVEQLQNGDFNEDTLNEWKEYYERSFAGEAFKIVRQENIHGQLVYEEISFNPIFDNSQQVTGVSCFARDITRQHLYTEMIEKQNKQLKNIAWMLSHEVRLPVANILGLVPLFNSTNIADPGNAQIISFLKEEAIKMDNLIRKITEETITVKNMESDFNKQGPGGLN